MTSEPIAVLGPHWSIFNEINRAKVSLKNNIKTAFELNMLQIIIDSMERMGPQQKSSRCSRGPLAHILRNKYSKKTSK